MKRLFFAAAVCAFALAGCGSATDAITFQAPPHYKAQASIGPFAQIWAGPDHNMIMVMALPTKIDLSKRADNSGNVIESDRQITICGGQPARFMTMRGTGFTVGGASPDPKSHPQNIEYLATIVSGKTYMAIYSRPLGESPDPAAEAAIHNICPRRQ